MKYQKLLLNVFILCVFFLEVKGQFFDKYGIRTGISIASQKWDYHLINYSLLKDYKAGLIILLSTEKNINNYLSVKSELGYIQKGFKSRVDLLMEDGIKHIDDNVILHNLSFNTGLKLKAFNIDFSPYINTGLRVDFLLDYTDIKCLVNGLEVGIYGSALDNFNMVILSGLLGTGIELGRYLYLELEYNPAITKSLDDEIADFTDRCYCVTLGFNISEFIR